MSRNNKEIRRPEIIACAGALRSKYNKVGAVGYCYGGWGCLQLGAKDNDLVDCISIAHPSIITTAEIDALNVPTQIIAPETDPQLTPELKEYCNRVIPGLGVPYMYDYYPGLRHGFAAKGELKFLLKRIYFHGSAKHSSRCSSLCMLTTLLGDPRVTLQKEGLERAKNSVVFWLKQFLH